MNSAALLFPFGFSTEQDRLETAACSGAPQRLAGLLTEGTRIYSRDQSRLVERQCSCPASLCGWAGRPARRCSLSAFSESRLFSAPERSARPVLQRVTGIVFSPPFFPLGALSRGRCSLTRSTSGKRDDDANARLCGLLLLFGRR